MKIAAVLLTIVGGICQQILAAAGPRSFNPSVSATCSQGFMKIRLRTRDPFHGIIHARDSRDNNCLTYGTGGINTLLTVSLLTPHDSDSYCGVVYDNATEVSQVALAVRAHRTLELAGDNFYVITCGKPGFRDTRNNQTTTVSLSLQNNGRRITEVTYGRQYQLQADISNPEVFSEEFGIRVKNCFAFSDKNSSVRLLNNEGCPERHILSEFKLYRSRGSANATLYSMFRFPDSNTIHFQCDIIVCESDCPLILCPDSPTEGRSLARLADEDNEDDHKMVASTTVFVVEPGASSLSAVSATCDLGPSWLLWLCVVFGVLFLIMLCVNVFLCSAMTCSFSKTEVDVVEEKEPSVYTIGQDYDPYRSWAGSQYGSKYSLDHPGTRPLSLDHPGTRSLAINSVDHPGTRTLGTPASSQYKEAYSNYGASNSRPGSRNGRQSGLSYHNGIGMYNSGPIYNGISTGPRPPPAVYQPTTPTRSRTPTRTPQRARSRSRHRTREAGQFDLAPDQYSLHSRPHSQTGSYKTAIRARVEDRL